MGITAPVAHRAQEDAMVTARIFTMLVSMLKAYECTDCADLHRRDLAGLLRSKRAAIIGQALEAKARLWLRYLSPADAEIIQEIVSPREIVRGPRSGAGHLIAYSPAAEAERRFELDRILDLRPLRAGP
jgi:predicted DNA-binding transcriptional regulator YafY